MCGDRLSEMKSRDLSSKVVPVVHPVAAEGRASNLRSVVRCAHILASDEAVSPLAPLVFILDTGTLDCLCFAVYLVLLC
jgi:hypothetical protein